MISRAVNKSNGFDLNLTVQFYWTILVTISFLALNSIYNEAQYFVSLLCIISLIIAIYSSYNKTKSIFSLYAVFIIVSYLFHFGQLILVFFGIPVITAKRYYVVDFSSYYIYLSIMYSLIGLNIFHLVGVYFLRPTNYEIDKKRHNTFKKKWILVYGVLFLAISFYSKFYIYFLQLSKAGQLGYVSAYTAGINEYIHNILSSFFPIAIYSFIYYFKEHKVLWKIPYFFSIILDLISMLYVGNRSMPLASILTLIFFRHRFVKPFSNKDYKSLGIYALIFMSLSNFVAVIRGSLEKKQLINSYFENIIKENFIIKILTEFGGTLQTLILCVINIPDSVNYAFLRTYLYSPLIIVPFSERILGDEITKYISVGSVMNPFIGGGLGGSFIAETYYNLGWFGLLIMLPIGYFIAKFNNFYFSTDIEKTPFRIVTVGLFVQAILLYPRGYFYSLVTTLNIMIYAFIISLPISFLFKGKKT